MRPAELSASLWLKKKPAFWGSRAWPGIGTDVDSSRRGTRLPAEDWFEVVKRKGPLPLGREDKEKVEETTPSGSEAMEEKG